MSKKLTKIFYKIDKAGFVTYDLNHNIPTKIMGNKIQKKIIISIGSIGKEIKKSADR